MTLYASDHRTSTLSLRSEAEDNLLDAITRLPDPYRIVVEMTLAGFTQVEIANDLRLTQQAVSARYRNALSNLKSTLVVE